jgi:hypothetical protein
MKMSLRGAGPWAQDCAVLETRLAGGPAADPGVRPTRLYKVFEGAYATIRKGGSVTK